MRDPRVKFVTPLLILLVAGVLTSPPALAYWELVPRVEGGITTCLLYTSPSPRD